MQIGPGIGVRDREHVQRVNRRPGLRQRVRAEAAPAPDGVAIQDLRRHTRRLDAGTDDRLDEPARGPPPRAAAARIASGSRVSPAVGYPSATVPARTGTMSNLTITQMERSRGFR